MLMPARPCVCLPPSPLTLPLSPAHSHPLPPPPTTHPPTLPPPALLCHPFQTEVRAIALAPNTQHAASAASGERHVAVWEVPPAKKSKKQHPAVATVSLEDAAVALDAAAAGEGAFHLAAVSEAGEAYVWACGPSGAVEGGPVVEAQLLMRVRVGDGVSRG